jgi:hypothetical protein
MALYYVDNLSELTGEVHEWRSPETPRCLYLVPKPTLWDGVGSIFDLLGTSRLYNYSRSPAEADRHALTCDWYAIGDDLWSVFLHPEQRDATDETETRPVMDADAVVAQR